MLANYDHGCAQRDSHAGFDEGATEFVFFLCVNEYGIRFTDIF